MRRPTIHDVAARAGVSKSLVSLALQGSPKVAEASREAILAAAAELDPIRLFDICWTRNGGIPHVVLPPAVTGVKANIVVMSARFFPTGSHKVGPGYSVLREICSPARSPRTAVARCTARASINTVLPGASSHSRPSRCIRPWPATTTQCSLR